MFGRVGPRKHRGATLTGYGLIVGLIAVVALAAVSTTGEEVACMLQDTADKMAGDEFEGCFEYILETTGRVRDRSAEQVVGLYDVPSILPGDIVAVTREQPIGNGVAEFEQSFTYPGNGAPVQPVGGETALGVICESGYVANATNDACFEAEQMPVASGFSHASNNSSLSATWQGGTGWQDCAIAYQTGPSSYQTLSSIDCANGQSSFTGGASLSGIIGSGWDGEDIVLMGTLQRDPGSGQQPLVTLGTLSCNDSMAGSSSPTPTVDEDCDGSFDNSALDTANAVTASSTYLASTSEQSNAVGPGQGLYAVTSGGASSLNARYICQCTMNSRDAQIVPGSAVEVSVHYSTRRTTSINRSGGINPGDPVTCSHGGSSWSFGGTVTYFPGIQSMQCALNRFF